MSRLPLWALIAIRVAVILAFCALLATVAGILGDGPPSEITTHPPHAEPAVSAGPTGTPSPPAAWGADAGGTTQAVLATQYLEGLQREREQQEVDAYLAALDATARAERDAAARASSRNAASNPPANNGAHSDAWWHAVAICEQGGRNDPYYGYFSIMDGSAGGLDWATQVAMANAIIARYGDRAWAASCVAAGYAASPGG